MPDDEDRLVVIVGEAGHDGVIVGETTVAVNLHEPGKQPRDRVLEARTIRVPR